MKRSAGRILTTHAGSLPRTETLVELLKARRTGQPLDHGALVGEIESSTSDVLHRQLDAGVDVASNGEQSRISFSTYVTQRMSGFGGQGQRRTQRDLADFPALILSPRSELRRPPKCIGPVSYERLDQVQQECDGLLKLAKGLPFEELFMTAASPGIIVLTMLNDYYPSYEEYVIALAEEMRKEYEVIASRGLMLQLDCPDLAMERHGSQQDQPISAFQELVRLNIRALNQSIRNIPADQVRIHVCWGNYPGPHHHDVAVADILPLLYEARVGAISLEMANPRHAHEYKVLQQYPLPQSMCVIPGVIDTKTNHIEHPEVVADRLQRVVEAVGDPTRVLAGTDCGFDTTAGSNQLDKGVVWAKLDVLREGAEIASQRISW